jgi:hypothetical protein
VKPKPQRERVLKFRVSKSEYTRILDKLPLGTEFSQWIRGLALSEERRRIGPLALAEHNTGRELAYIGASIDALAQAVAASKPVSLPEWLLVLYRIRESAIDLAYGSARSRARSGEPPSASPGKNVQ